MIPITKASIFVEKGTQRQTPGEAIFTGLRLVTSAKAFGASAARALDASSDCRVDFIQSDPSDITQLEEHSLFVLHPMWAEKGDLL